jgi:DMSO/TMAO reductase YedYZ molybdopterin-dependent catalytic subunit
VFVSITLTVGVAFRHLAKFVTFGNARVSDGCLAGFARERLQSAAGFSVETEDHVISANRPTLRAALGGFIAALSLVMGGLIVRAVFGIGTISELASDRLAPLMGIPLFFKMLNLLGGYSNLKELGVILTLAGQIIGGTAVGILYGRLAGSRSRGTARVVTALVVGFLCLLTIAGLWPNLATNYDGLPPSRALPASIVTLLLLSAFFAIVLFWMEPLLAAPTSSEQSAGQGRRFVLAGAVASVATLVSGALLARFYSIATYDYDGTENTGENLPPVTPNGDFYQVTKNNIDPRPSLAFWGLEVGGMVTRPMLLRRPDLEAMPSVTQEVTLQCISDPVDGGLNSNAVWRGVTLLSVLQAAGLTPGAKQVMFHGADGFTDDLPIEKALDPQTLLAFEMNGEPLPQRHGFPLRVIVPGFVGEKSVKWLTKIEVRATPGKGFYEEQGWGPQFTINDGSRFDAPDFDHPIRLGQRTVLKGTAFAGDRGVRAVQVSVDGEKTWQPAEISYRGSNLAWAQWRFPWVPDKPGQIMLAVRCIDGEGQVQSGEEKKSGPEPASGYDRVKARVEA